MIISAGNKKIGDGQPCFVAAEIGINHNGDMDLAMRTIDAAVEAGADAVKFQNYYTEDFIFDKQLSYSYVSQGKNVTETQFDMFKRNELSFEQLSSLKSYCDQKNVLFFSTPTSARGVDELVRLKTPLLKNGSDLLVNLALIKYMAQSGLPTIISTGMATLSEIDEAVRAFESAGGKELMILHCISSYPTPFEEVHLNKITALQKAFGHLVGFSDHTYGTTAAIGAVVLGACFVEKHFTLDKNLPGPDHRFSSDPDELKQLVSEIKNISSALGISKIGPTKSEQEGRRSFRLSCSVNKELPKGTVLKEEDICFLRPATGLHPHYADLLIGKRVIRNLAKGEMINLNDLADGAF